MRKKAVLPKKWQRQVLDPCLSEIQRLCTLKTAQFSSNVEENEHIKETIRIWIRNIECQVEYVKASYEAK